MMTLVPGYQAFNEFWNLFDDKSNCYLLNIYYRQGTKRFIRVTLSGLPSHLGEVQVEYSLLEMLGTTGVSDFKFSGGDFRLFGYK